MADKVCSREYLDRDFRKALSKGGKAEIVEAAAEYIQQQVGYRGCYRISLGPPFRLGLFHECTFHDWPAAGWDADDDDAVVAFVG